MLQLLASAVSFLLICSLPSHGLPIHNPEENMNVSQIIKFFEYPVENHEVVTKDGYVLSLQRIPHGKTSQRATNGVVYLQHGLLDSSATWVMNFPNQSFPFILADKGFEVWLGNCRGNTYSTKHIKFASDSAQYWDFSFDEMAKYDLPAMVDYILKTSGHPELHYVGHSQGTMIGFIEFARNQELSKKITAFHALAPVATVGHIKGALRVLSNFASEVQFLYKILGMHQFFPNGWFLKFISEVVCTVTSISEEFCGDLMFLMTGFDEKNLDVSRIPIYATHTPAGTSVKNVIHFVQMIRSGKFQMYDYGADKNMKVYNQTAPPLYDVSTMKTPVSLFSGTNDWLADPDDIKQNLRPYLKEVLYSKDIEDYNHLDFIWGENAHSVVFKDIIKLMNKKEKK